MTDTVQEHDISAEMAAADLEALKAKADLLGVEYHPSIGAAKLSEKIMKHQSEDKKPELAKAEPARETPGQKAKRVKDAALKLVRVNVTCMNAAKSEWDGEIFTVGNSIIPTQRKFVPFNTVDGYHIPQIMYDMMVAKEVQVFFTERVNGRDIRKSKQIPEFSIAVLPQLNEKELADLAKIQAASGIIQ